MAETASKESLSRSIRQALCHQGKYVRTANGDLHVIDWFEIMRATRCEWSFRLVDNGCVGELILSGAPELSLEDRFEVHRTRTMTTTRTPMTMPIADYLTELSALEGERGSWDITTSEIPGLLRNLLGECPLTAVVNARLGGEEFTYAVEDAREAGEHVLNLSPSLADRIATASDGGVGSALRRDLFKACGVSG